MILIMNNKDSTVLYLTNLTRVLYKYCTVLLGKNPFLVSSPHLLFTLMHMHTLWLLSCLIIYLFFPHSSMFFIAVYGDPKGWVTHTHPSQCLRCEERSGLVECQHCSPGCQCDQSCQGPSG